MASGDSLNFFAVANAEPPPTNFATFDTRNQILVLDFDDTTDESIEFPGFMPEHYAGTTGVTVTVGWAATTATTGTISLDVAFKRLGDDTDDLDSATFAAANNANPTTSTTSGNIIYTDITFTDGADMDSVVAGEHFRLQISRDADGTTSTDNLVGDMELISVLIKET